jgi:tungstate transport system ATP-binding protein
VTVPVLELAEIAVRAGGQTILDVCHFAVAAGETVAIVGPNGAGKTTLLHVAALLRQPDAGQVALLGQPATPQSAASLRRSISVVFQNPLLFDVNVLDNASAGLRFQGHPRAEAHAQAMTWLERFGVGHLAKRRARELSGGEASRVALARAFATEPAILLLDEPFSSLDAPTRAPLLPALRERLRQTGTASVLVTHDLTEAFAFGDRIALIDRGRFVAVGDGLSLVARPPSRRAAELLAIETILPGVVTSAEGQHALVTLQPEGPTVRVNVPNADNLLPDTPATFTLPAGAADVYRPDEVLPPGRNAVAGVVTAVSHLPSGTRIEFATPAPIVALTQWEPIDRRWAVGDHAMLAFRPEAAHLILGRCTYKSSTSPVLQS